VSWRLTEWGAIMGALCWLFVRMWTDKPANAASRASRARRRRRRVESTSGGGEASAVDGSPSDDPTPAPAAGAPGVTGPR